MNKIYAILFNVENPRKMNIGYTFYHVKCVFPVYFYKFKLINFKNEFLTLAQNDENIFIKINWRRRKCVMYIILKSTLDWEELHLDLIKTFEFYVVKEYNQKGIDKYKWYLLRSYQLENDNSNNNNLISILENNIEDNFDDELYLKKINQDCLTNYKKYKKKKADLLEEISKQKSKPDDLDDLADTSDSDIETTNIDDELVDIFKKKMYKIPKKSKKIIKKN